MNGVNSHEKQLNDLMGVVSKGNSWSIDSTINKTTKSFIAMTL